MNNGLERDIFGGSDSELSEDDDWSRQRKLQVPREDSSNENDQGDGAGNTKKRGARGEGDRPSRKKRKKDDKVAEEPQQELDPEQMRRLQLNQQIDAAVKQKSRPKKRKKKEGEEDLDGAADDEVTHLKHDMELAADDDVQANNEKRPATAKLRMLDQVMAILQRQSHHQAIFDNNLLQAVRRWLEPLPDKSLPALNIQKAFFEVLPKMDIDTNTLKDAGLGRIVVFYTRCKRVTPPIKRAADTLVDVWSRPIIKRSASFRDREMQMPTSSQTTVVQSKMTKVQLMEVLSRKDDDRVRKNAVRIPERDLGNYKNAPAATIAPNDAKAVQEREARKATQDRTRKMQRKLALHKQKSARL